MTEVLRLKIKFLDALSAAQLQRSHRHDWVEYERRIMCDLMRQELLTHGHAPHSAASMTEAAEKNALGHTDYSHKFALGCAEYAVYGRRMPIGGFDR